MLFGCQDKLNFLAAKPDHTQRVECGEEKDYTNKGFRANRLKLHIQYFK